jgi:type IV fimbrial biogenesis protein FimT
MNERGVGLVEIMIVTALAALTLVIGGGGFIVAAAKQRGKVVTTELAAELRAARHLALINQQRVRVVFRPETSEIKTELADTPGRIIRRFDFRDRRVVVESLSNGPAITFYPSGRTATPTTITLRDAEQDRWQMTVSLTGRISILSGL